MSEQPFDEGPRLQSHANCAPSAIPTQQVGLSIVGDTILRAAETAPEPAVERVGINLSGIPTELREMFQELVRQPISDLPSLRAEIKQHVAAMEQEYQVNEFIDLSGAHTLAQHCELLLNRWENLPVSDRHLAHAAIRYFVSWDDVTNDLDIGGLDDDKQIMKAVLDYLGVEEVADGALAS